MQRDEKVTYDPADVSADDLLRVRAALRRDADGPPALRTGEDSDPVELPARLTAVLVQVVEAMSAGLAVTVVPHSRMLTTQQAADLLGVSRPTLVRLLEDGALPHERTGTHRRVRLTDVLDYRERRRAAQYAALDRAAEVSVDDPEDLDRTLGELRATRRAVAARRRRRPEGPVRPS